MTETALKCRFGCDDPVGVYHIPAGCVCWTDPVQALCWQHADKAQSQGPMELLLDLREPALTLKNIRLPETHGQ
jgi:hypothetical protein